MTQLYFRSRIKNLTPIPRDLSNPTPPKTSDSTLASHSQPCFETNITHTIHTLFGESVHTQDNGSWLLQKRS